MRVEIGNLSHCPQVVRCLTRRKRPEDAAQGTCARHATAMAMSAVDPLWTFGTSGRISEVDLD
jgi:hypothetical protein